MKEIFKQYLFSKHFFVNENGESRERFETLFSLGSLFGIKIVSGQSLAEKEMIALAADELGVYVAEPFYRGFPESVKNLTSDERLFDQLFHYFQTYGLGRVEQAGHSIMEESFERLAFNENHRLKEFSILTLKEAEELLESSVRELLAGSRPLNEENYNLIYSYIVEYKMVVGHCACKETAIRLLVDTRDINYMKYLTLADVIKVTERLDYQEYTNRNIKKLNLTNQDRKFIQKLIDEAFASGRVDISECYEKKALWCGLLHHIHYKPLNDEARSFADMMRSKGNASAYSQFERHMLKGEIEEAFHSLSEKKGSGAVLRRLSYILSRCEGEDDLEFVLNNIKSDNPIVMLQLLMAGRSFMKEGGRVFRFTKFNRLRVHTETLQEVQRRKSRVPSEVIFRMGIKLKDSLKDIYKGRLGKVYIDEGMKSIALPLQENASLGGYGVLPKGSRISIGADKKVRAFIYWEKVDDIDLSVISLGKNGTQEEFSWRTMADEQSDMICYSGDQTSGFSGGSEFFDVDTASYRKSYPDAEYLVFCGNVFSGVPFSDCTCRAGYMLRDKIESGEVFEAKAVDSSFNVNAETTFAYLFGIDLAKGDFVWLNLARESTQRIAGATEMGFLRDYFEVTSVINLYDFFAMLCREQTGDISQAEVIVGDGAYPDSPGRSVIHSWDIPRIIELMNK